MLIIQRCLLLRSLVQVSAISAVSGIVQSIIAAAHRFVYCIASSSDPQTCFCRLRCEVRFLLRGTTERELSVRTSWAHQHPDFASFTDTEMNQLSCVLLGKPEITAPLQVPRCPVHKPLQLCQQTRCSLPLSGWGPELQH